MAQSAVSEASKAELRAITAALDPAEGVALALALGDEAVSLYAQVYRVSPRAARAILRQRTGAGRIPSVATR